MTPAQPVSVKEHVLRLAQKLPASPQIFSRLSLLLDDMNADMGKVVNLISIDAALTSRVIRLSNSVFFRGRTPVQSLDEAIGRIGFREVHRIVGVAMTEQIFKDGLPSYNLTSAAVWENSVVTALAMERLARATAMDEGGAYTLGLLRTVGKLVLGRILEKEHPGIVCPDDTDVDTWERARLNIASPEASAVMLESWKMPRELFQGVRHHHQPEIAPADGPMGALLHLSCWVANSLGKGIKAEAPLWELTNERLHQAGLSEAAILECVPDIEGALNKLKAQLSGP
jgi:HD-like signal output (HDOD) protein